LFCEKPLIWWNLNALSQSHQIDEIIVATDDENIKDIIAGFKLDNVVIYDRDPKNATDQASSESVILEFINQSDLDHDDLFILVQATSPFTQTMDFEGALAKYKNEDCDSLLSVVESKRFFWSGEGSPLNYDFQNRPRRQDFDGVYMENGAFYMNTVGRIKSSSNRLSGKIGVYKMPTFTGLELDDEDDWIIGEEIMRRKILG